MPLNKIKIVLLFFAILLLVLSLMDFYCNLNRSYQINDRFTLFINSFKPDKSIKFSYDELNLKQPFISKEWAEYDDYEVFGALYKFGFVRYSVVYYDSTIIWRSLAFYSINNSEFKDIWSVLYEYKTNNGPVYVYYDLIPLMDFGDVEKGFETVMQVIIPHKKMLIDIYKTREDMNSLLEFARPFISDDPEFKYELIDIHYGGQQEWLDCR